MEDAYVPFIYRNDDNCTLDQCIDPLQRAQWLLQLSSGLAVPMESRWAIVCGSNREQWLTMDNETFTVPKAPTHHVLFKLHRRGVKEWNRSNVWIVDALAWREGALQLPEVPAPQLLLPIWNPNDKRSDTRWWSAGRNQNTTRADGKHRGEDCSRVQNQELGRKYIRLGRGIVSWVR